MSCFHPFVTCIDCAHLFMALQTFWSSGARGRWHNGNANTITTQSLSFFFFFFTFFIIYTIKDNFLYIRSVFCIDRRELRTHAFVLRPTPDEFDLVRSQRYLFPTCAYGVSKRSINIQFRVRIKLVDESDLEDD